jgi:hypothetical protein
MVQDGSAAEGFAKFREYASDTVADSRLCDTKKEGSFSLGFVLSSDGWQFLLSELGKGWGRA